MRAGHPWIYAESITSLGRSGRPGDLVVVFDDRRRFAAIGLYDPASPIRVKVLHHGRPVTIDADWWSARIAESAARREPLLTDGATTGYRVVHGENDGLPGLVVDRYGDHGRREALQRGVDPLPDPICAAVAGAVHPDRVVIRGQPDGGAGAAHRPRRRR